MLTAQVVRPLLVGSAVLLLLVAGWQMRNERDADAGPAATPSTADTRGAGEGPSADMPATRDAPTTRVPAQPADAGASQDIARPLPDVSAIRAAGVATAAPGGRLEARVLQDGYVLGDEAERILGAKDFSKEMRDVQADPRANSGNAIAYRQAYEEALAQDGSGHHLRDIACSSNVCMMRIDLGAKDRLGKWYGSEALRKRAPMPTMTYAVAGLQGGGYEARLLFTTDPGIPGGIMMGSCDPTCQAARTARRRALHDGTQG